MPERAPRIEPRLLRRPDAAQAKVLAQIDAMSEGARRAAAVGDLEAFVELISAAAGLLQIAKALEPIRQNEPLWPR